MSQQREIVRNQENRQDVKANSYQSIRPKVDIFEDNNGITLVADLPGVSREKLDIEIDNEILSIDGEVGIPLSGISKDGSTGITATRYQRSFSLNTELDGEQVEATLKDGVLALNIPKRQEYKPRKIEIRTE